MSYTNTFRKMCPVGTYSTYTIKCIEQDLTESDFSDIQDPQHMDVLQNQKLLVCATLASDVTRIKELLNSGVSIETAEYNKHLLYKCKYYLTPLQIATAQGDLDTLEYLIHQAADVNCKDRYNVTPAHMAAEQGYDECLQILIENGAKCSGLLYCRRTPVNPVPFYLGSTPLHIAVTNAHFTCIEKLLKYYPDYNAFDEKGRNAPYIASELGAEECILFLLKSTVGRSILSKPGFIAGETPLHFAIAQDKLQLIEKLLLLGSDVHCKNANGFSPMDMCLKNIDTDPKHSIKLLKLLILSGWNTDININHGHLLKFVVHNDVNNNKKKLKIDESREFTKFLIAFGANTNFTNSEGSFLQCEFKNFDSDPSVLKTILDCYRFPPTFNSIFPDIQYLGPSVTIINNKILIRGMKKLSRGQKRKIRMANWYEISYPRLPSLQHLCRNTIREAMGTKRLNKVTSFQIANKLVSYILLGIEI